MILDSTDSGPNPIGLKLPPELTWYILPADPLILYPEWLVKYTSHMTGKEWSGVYCIHLRSVSSDYVAFWLNGLNGLEGLSPRMGDHR